MKHLFIKGIALSTLAFTFGLASAHADGFFCEGESTGLKIAVLNHTLPSAGTRTPDTLEVSNPILSPEYQKIVTFSDKAQNLSYQGYGNFLGKIDQSILRTSRADATIAGIALKQLKSILVDIRFSYDPATSALARIAKSIPGKVKYTKASGEVLDEKITCTRYLKARH